MPCLHQPLQAPVCLYDCNAGPLMVRLCCVPAHDRKQGPTQLGHVLCRLGCHVSGCLQAPSFFNPLLLSHPNPYPHPNTQEPGNSELRIMFSNIHSRHLHIKLFLFNYCLGSFATSLKEISNLARKWTEIIFCKDTRQVAHVWL